MNILVGAPNANFNLLKMKAKLFEHPNIKNEKLFFVDQDLTDEQLALIDVFFGYDKDVLNRILNDPNSHLNFIQSLSVGIDYFPLKLIKKRGIKIATVKGIHIEPIAETIIGMILSQARNLNRINKLNQWKKPQHPFKILSHKTALLFGTGGIGARTADLLRTFHVKTLGVNTTGHPVSGFDEVMPLDDLRSEAFDADMVINSLPLTDATNQIFDDHFFERLTSQPLFVNVGRGQSVNTDAMIKALTDEQLDSASLDVVDPEPLPDSSPLWQMDNVFISPHIASLFDHYGDDSLSIFDDNLKRLTHHYAPLMNEVKL